MPPPTEIPTKKTGPSQIQKENENEPDDQAVDSATHETSPDEGGQPLHGASSLSPSPPSPARVGDWEDVDQEKAVQAEPSGTLKDNEGVVPTEEETAQCESDGPPEEDVAWEKGGRQPYKGDKTKAGSTERAKPWFDLLAQMCVAALNVDKTQQTKMRVTPQDADGWMIDMSKVEDECVGKTKNIEEYRRQLIKESVTVAGDANMSLEEKTDEVERKVKASRKTLGVIIRGELSIIKELNGSTLKLSSAQEETKALIANRTKRRLAIAIDALVVATRNASALDRREAIKLGDNDLRVPCLKRDGKSVIPSFALRHVLLCFDEELPSGRASLTRTHVRIEHCDTFGSSVETEEKQD